MALGYLNLTYQSKVLPYNDEKTPVELTGKKMLPIALIGGKSQNESLDIMEKIDEQKKLHWQERTQLAEFERQVLTPIGSMVHSMAMPYWVWLPEFDQESRHYFQQKKELKRGPFGNLVKAIPQVADELVNYLNENSHLLKLRHGQTKLTVKEIMLAAHLWGCYIVPEFQFPAEWHRYLQAIKQETKFNYHEDFWKL